MADVNGSLIGTTTFDPLRENASGQTDDTTTFDPLVEDGSAVEVFNSTNPSGGGGGATVVRQNPELTRSNP
jgi:hypothetical protein